MVHWTLARDIGFTGVSFWSR